MWRADESGLMALPWSEPRTKRGQMWKYSASKSERLKGQIRNHRSGKYRPATFVQIRNHHQTDRDICHFTKFPTTLNFYQKFLLSGGRSVKHEMVWESNCSFVSESILTSRYFWIRLTLPCQVVPMQDSSDKLTNTVGKIFVYICTTVMLTVTCGFSNTCFMCLHLTGRKSFNELGCGTFDLSRPFWPDFMFVLASDPRKT